MTRLVQLLVVCGLVVAFAGCYAGVMAPGPSEPVVVRQPGPPPHAPAHGYRRKHPSGPELRYDAGLGVYVVVGQTEVYFHDGWFIRVRSGAFEISAALAGPWRPGDASSIPPGLRAKHPKHAKKPGKGGGPKPAKGGW
jgi:hypothetical protein